MEMSEQWVKSTSEGGKKSERENKPEEPERKAVEQSGKSLNFCLLIMWVMNQEFTLTNPHNVLPVF